MGTPGVGDRPPARGLGEPVVTVQSPGILLGPQHCRAPGSPPVPCFSGQNETMASALGRGSGRRAGLSAPAPAGTRQGPAGSGSGVVATAAHRPRRVHDDSIILSGKPVLWPQSTRATCSSPSPLCVRWCPPWGHTQSQPSGLHYDSTVGPHVSEWQLPTCSLCQVWDRTGPCPRLQGAALRPAQVALLGILAKARCTVTTPPAWSDRGLVEGLVAIRVRAGGLCIFSFTLSYCSSQQEK